MPGHRIKLVIVHRVAPRHGQPSDLLTGLLQARRDGSTVDEPFAWEAREFVRKKCIGQVSQPLHIDLCRGTNKVLTEAWPGHAGLRVQGGLCS
jgi:hypothetical protein